MILLFQRFFSLFKRKSSRSSEERNDGGKDEFGKWGEDQAARLLKKEGYSIVGRRVRPNLHDELDIIAKKGQILVFVEVKSRRDEAFGRPAAAVDTRKRRALVRGAHAFLRNIRRKDLYIRYDVVEVIGYPTDTNPPPTIRHIEDAFRAADVKRRKRHR